MKKKTARKRPAAPRRGREQAAYRIGADIRGLRKAKRWTLAELADRIGRSVGYVSKLERDLAKPSISDLKLVAETLGVSIGWFFHPHGSDDPVERSVIVRRENRRRLDFAPGVSDFLLSPNMEGPIEMLWSVLEPGAGSGHEPYTHAGDEAGLIIAGTLEIWIGEARYVLNEGDSFAFKSTTPHRYHGIGPGRTVVVWAITPPSY